MELRKALIIANQKNLEITRKEWMVNQEIHFIIHPTNSGSVGMLLISKNQKTGELNVGKLWHPSYEDIMATDWEVATIDVQTLV